MYTSFSCRFLKSKTVIDNLETIDLSNTSIINSLSTRNLITYNKTINIIASKLLTIKVIQGVSTIKHNFNENYDYYCSYILKHIHTYKNINILRTNICKLVNKKFVNSNILPDDCLEIIYQYSYGNIPLFVINDIINIWYQKFNDTVHKIITDNYFDKNWYDIGSIDYNWASNTIDDCNKNLKLVQFNITNQ